MIKKKSIIFLFNLLIFLFTNRVYAGQQYEGIWAWEKNNGSRDFSVKIINNGKYYIGTYCAVVNNGGRIDCSENDTPSFQFKNTQNDIITTEFKTYYTESTGKVKLTFHKNKLTWEIIKEPKGEYYCPKKAILYKIIE
ncbi:MAG: hypothetical protein PHF84_09755 [bacterium]|nr:hypothetical protein [bacterium]